MRLTVARATGTELSTPGLLDIDGVFRCYTLEPRIDRSRGKPFAIPAGIYEVRLLPSPKFECVTPHLLNVPGFSGIEIHWGNYPSDTEGCTLVGETRQQDFVGNSRQAFGRLMEKLAAATDAITIEYVASSQMTGTEGGL